MNFENKLISGIFIKRYKRFFVDVQIENKLVTAHCPNTGSMLGLLNEGNKVWLSKSDNPNRKLKYTLQIIEDNRSKVGVNTHATNKIVLSALKNGFMKEFKKNLIITFSKSGTILTSFTDIPHFEFNQFDINAIFLSWVLPERISLPIIKIAAFTFLFFFFID